MQQYLDEIHDIIENGVVKGNRTGVHTHGVFGRMNRYDISGEKLPLLTTKKMGIKFILAELLWFLEGSTDNNRLRELGTSIWDEWATDDGDLGPIYGKQWVNWDTTISVNKVKELIENPDMHHLGLLSKLRELVEDNPPINQIQRAVDDLKNNPNSRRIIVSAWNPAELPDERHSPQTNVQMGKMALAACHTLFQFYTKPISDEELLETNPGLKALYEKYNDMEHVKATAKTLDIPLNKLSCLLLQR